MTPSFLNEKVVNIIKSHPKGDVLDLACGNGDAGKSLFDLGYKVTAADMDVERFQYRDQIPFIKCDLSLPLPFPDKSFDYVIFCEVIEHIYNPQHVIHEISRVLRKGGRLILSTPNILHVGSRLRFLFEGSFDLFREPPLDYSKVFPAAIQNMHVVPWRYHELEYLLSQNDLKVDLVQCDSQKKSLKGLAYLLKPILLLQAYLKEKRSRKKGGVDYRRINQIILSDDLLLGRHIIVSALK